jgi:hypothetical protein
MGKAFSSFSTRFVQRQMVWWPTRLGWLCGMMFVATCVISWTLLAERWLSLTAREPAKVLVVEGWIGLEGMKAAADEFNLGKCDLVVGTGGLTGERWNVARWNYAEMATKELRRLGIPPEQVLPARAREIESQRTFEAAVAAWKALQAAGVRPQAINVLTRGPHARRSRLIYARVFGDDTKVGVISWTPESEVATPWWGSSDRASDLIKESVGYPFELFLNSGRSSNSPQAQRAK